MNKAHNISVIITTYNSSEHIVSAVQSVLAQLDVTIEIIIVDDCSADFQLLTERVNAIVGSTPTTILQPEHKGNANISRNIGIKNAQYDHVAFLDADDTWNPKHLITSINTLKEMSLDGCFCQVKLLSDKGSIKSVAKYDNQSDICRYIFKQNGISVTSALVINKSTLLDISFDNELAKHQDWDFLIRYANKYRLGQSPYYGLNYTLSTGVNMSSSFNFSASIRFMNLTLPVIWHPIFINGQVSKILEQQTFEQLVLLFQQLTLHYNQPLSRLGAKNTVTLLSSKNKLMFRMLVKYFQFIKAGKTYLRALIK